MSQRRWRRRWSGGLALRPSSIRGASLSVDFHLLPVAYNQSSTLHQICFARLELFAFASGPSLSYLTSLTLTMNHFPHGWGRVSSIPCHQRVCRILIARSAQRWCLRRIRLLPLWPSRPCRSHSTYSVTYRYWYFSHRHQVQGRCCHCRRQLRYCSSAMLP